MKAMLLGFLAAVVIALGAGYFLNTSVQQTADVRFVGAGTDLRHGESGTNLVGKDWSGIATP